MTYRQLIKFYGTQAQAARMLSYSTETLRQWKIKGIPVRAQELIQAYTARALRVGRRK